MKLPFRSLVLPAVISVLTLQLSGCGEGGSTLADPVAQRINTITTCDNNADICTSGQFIDEPVVGLNYECNQVKGLTDKEGVFSCPNNSVVKFYLQSEKGKYRINIGVYLIKALGNLTGSRQTVLLQITPKDLVASISANKTETVTLQVTNILRLLQLMDSDGYNDKTDVLNRIVITDDDKSFIDLIARDLGVSAFAETLMFEKTIEPLTAKLALKNRTLPSAESANARFSRSILALQSGLYEVSPLIVSTTDAANRRYYSGMVGETTQSSEKAFEGLLFVVDRDGKSMGVGLEWRTSLASTDSNTLLQKTLFESAPSTLIFTSHDMGFDSTGKVKPNFKLVAANSDVIEITQGVMDKGNLLGNEFFYRNVYGLASTEAVDSTKLGKWKRTGILALEGTVNMSKTRNVTPFLDGAIWKTKDNDTKPIFPLHLKLTFNDNDSKTCSSTGCLVGVMGISILENGNIITDLNNNCRAVTNLKENADPAFPADELIDEHRLGVITAAFNDETSGAAIAPMILVDDWAKTTDNKKWAKFYGIFMGMQSGLAGGSKVQIDIARVRDKIVTIQNQKDEQKAGSGVSAAWTNYIGFLTALSTTPADVQAQDANKAQGRIAKIEVQTCNTFLN